MRGNGVLISSLLLLYIFLDYIQVSSFEEQYCHLLISWGFSQTDCEINLHLNAFRQYF